VRLAGQIELQRGLGNVEADVEDGVVVLTHTCVDTSRDGCRAEALKQRFEFGTMGGAERALWRITLRAYARHERSRSRRRPPTCRREGDPSLVSASQRTKWTIFKIQGPKAQRMTQIRGSKAEIRSPRSKVAGLSVSVSLWFNPEMVPGRGRFADFCTFCHILSPPERNAQLKSAYINVFF
jgi:hypothetical protein